MGAVVGAIGGPIGSAIGGFIGGVGMSLLGENLMQGAFDAITGYEDPMAKKQAEEARAKNFQRVANQDMANVERQRRERDAKKQTDAQRRQREITAPVIINIDGGKAGEKNVELKIRQENSPLSKRPIPTGRTPTVNF